MQNNISVVLSGYSHAEALKKVLWGYNTQTYRNFEMVIIGNAEVPQELQEELFFSVRAVDNQSNGTVIDTALPYCTTNYLLLADAGAIPRNDFVEQHIKYREEGFYLTGGVTMIPQALFDGISREDIYSGKCFIRPGSGSRSGLFGSILNRLVPPDSQWNSQNASGWKEDLCGHGPLSSRLRPRQIKYSTMCLRANSR
ncbi:hypothetical protein CHU92_11610 [Flavobacterium cyanobacteriorum]|uniref:Glycosyltransferase 2-like domain-containing protein n=1 Tax=Flavobacterium cyanobacteriorum TaxID=2022802 RepID=A0A255YZJ6_9FLAO|nr:hypothetical protein [Flavobacterium cyanobacteriorum]OYQ34673.1 hypothetical protein CHU92_11610 [Flavobacterium cyanobacteriorum]